MLCSNSRLSILVIDGTYSAINLNNSFTTTFTANSSFKKFKTDSPSGIIIDKVFRKL